MSRTGELSSGLNKPSAKQILGGVGYASWLGTALVIGSFLGWASRSPMLSTIVKNPLGWVNTDPRIAFGGRNTETLLILGCDEDRFYRGTKLHGQNIYKKFARSDMMLVTKLDFDNNTITGLSIPRDTECRVPELEKIPLLRGSHKINAFHELAPPKEADEITKEAVNQILPTVPIDKVVDLDFEAIQKLVDIVGGVEVNVPKAMNYDDNAGELHIHLKPGLQKLNGYDAMCFVRFRHDRESDFGRQQRQKEFLASFKEAAFKNLGALPEIATQGKECLNNALDNEELLALAAFARRVPPQNIRMGMVPVVEGDGTRLHVDQKVLQKRLAEFGFSGNGTSIAGASSAGAATLGSAENLTGKS
jgi:LCP family protein required for cell wall assembly